MNEENNEITPETFAKYKPNPLDGLPEYLKEPDSYMKIQKAMYETLGCPKSHAEIVEMAECAKCTEKMLQRRALMKKLGFNSVAQYMAWKKTHEQVKERIPMEYYNSK